ncbi:MAG TPA: OmpA family protein [Muribaculaceae bacterium]|jgi:outer membrane protein OmpA-like peptidoglycan-associated protein|nr:OmpA family protein [Muribaculaceae bacterium]
MKKMIVMAALAMGAMSASAQTAIEEPGFFDNFSIGLDGGVTTPMTHHAFFGNMRGVAGINIYKQVTPAFALGVEGAFGVNTSSWRNRVHSSTAFDNSYVGAFGAVDLFNLFGGYNCEGRVFDIDVVAGAGWGHLYQSGDVPDHNYFATKVGLNFNFNVSPNVTIALKPSIVWDMSDGGAKQSSASYNANRATVNVMAGVTYHFGDGFQCVTPYNQAEIDALNGVINDLRGTVEAQAAANVALQEVNNGLAADLAACMSRPAQVVKEKSTDLSSVRYIFFKVGSSNITADQKPNVEMIAAYMNNHPKSKVVIKGYASPEGNEEFNIRLAQKRAESVKDALIKRYKIAADRITAEGEGIGHMFSEESWNRVSICTLEETK